MYEALQTPCRHSGKTQSRPNLDDLRSKMKQDHMEHSLSLLYGLALAIKKIQSNNQKKTSVG